MALEPRRIFLDVQNRQFVPSPVSTLPAASALWINEDVESVELFALRPTTDLGTPYAFLDLSSATVKFAVGADDPAAFQSVWTPIDTAVSVTASAIVDSALTDAEQRILWSGAGPVVGSYALQFPGRSVNATVREQTIYAANHGLYDGAVVNFELISTSTFPPESDRDYIVTNAAQNTFQIREPGQDALALQVSSAASVTVLIPPVLTGPIAYNATVAEVQRAIVDAGFVVNGLPQILVSGENGKQLDLYYGGRSGKRQYPTVVIANNRLRGAPGLRANVSYNTEEIAALIEAGTLNVTLEIEISEGAVRQTFRQPATLSPDLITSTSPSPLPANVATSFDLQSQNGSVFTVSVTNDGELMIAEQP